MRLQALIAGACAIALTAACEMATDIDLIELDALGELSGTLYLDLNGSSTLDEGDQGLRQVAVRILRADTGEEVRRTETDSAGVFRFDEVPAGQYSVAFPVDLLGDSLIFVEPPPTALAMDVRDSAVVAVGASYPTVTLEELFALAEGVRVFTHGIALNARDPFGDGVVHIEEDGRYLRMTDVERSALGPGDSIRVLGRTATSLGRPILDAVAPFALITSATVPIPITLASGTARQAQSGTLDAALVRVDDATITQVTGSESEGFVVRVNDGSGILDVQIPSYLSPDGALLEPGNRVSRVVGLLRPNGSGAWDLYLRAFADLSVEP